MPVFATEDGANQNDRKSISDFFPLGVKVWGTVTQQTLGFAFWFFHSVMGGTKGAKQMKVNEQKSKYLHPQTSIASKKKLTQQVTNYPQT